MALRITLEKKKGTLTVHCEFTIKRAQALRDSKMLVFRNDDLGEVGFEEKACYFCESTIRHVLLNILSI